MTISELIKESGIESNKLDSALPQSFFNSCIAIGIAEPLKIFAGWYYGGENNRFGRAMSIGELYALREDRKG